MSCVPACSLFSDPGEKARGSSSKSKAELPRTELTGGEPYEASVFPSAKWSIGLRGFRRSLKLWWVGLFEARHRGAGKLPIRDHDGTEAELIQMS